MKHIKLGLLLILCSTFLGCEKGLDERKITFTTDRPCKFDNMNTSVIELDCTPRATSFSFIAKKGENVHWEIRSCDYAPVRLIITLDRTIGKDKILRNATGEAQIFEWEIE